jgi:alpha-L-fucosidase
MFSRCLRVGVLCCVAIAVASPAISKTQAPACRPARYQVEGKPVGRGLITTETIDLGESVALGTACPGVAPRRVRVSRKGVTRIDARWRSCAGFRGRVRLKAKVVDGCSRLVARVKARKYRRRFEALRAECAEGILDPVLPGEPFTADRASLGTHVVPAWFDGAKFGIMIHWGIFTIPAWAETILDPAEWLAEDGLLGQPPDYGREWFLHNPYTEWYSNTIRIDGSPAQAHHRATYGADFAYESFRPRFEEAAAGWAADPWAELFAEAGARYVVFVTKHHDGFALWPTDATHPLRPGWHAARDFVGELTTAVRQRCMRMGLYYSGGLDWSVHHPRPIASVPDVLGVTPKTREYAAYADAQWRELISRYRPAVLWNDIGYPTAADGLALFADYYNTVPEGVINDRFTILPGFTHHDYVTPEFNVLRDISERKFETVRGMGRGFGYNANETDAHYDSAATLIHLLIDVVSKNGNLLLNVGPRADGSIPVEQVERLRAMGVWLRTNGAAIFGTRPWIQAEGRTAAGAAVRFTASPDGHTVYAIVLAPVAGGALTLVGVPELALPAPRRVGVLGASGDLEWALDGAGLRITVPAGVPPAPAHAFVLEFS